MSADSTHAGRLKRAREEMGDDPTATKAAKTPARPASPAAPEAANLDQEFARSPTAAAKKAPFLKRMPSLGDRPVTAPAAGPPSKAIPVGTETSDREVQQRHPLGAKDPSRGPGSSVLEPGKGKLEWRGFAGAGRKPGGSVANGALTVPAAATVPTTAQGRTDTEKRPVPAASQEKKAFRVLGEGGRTNGKSEPNTSNNTNNTPQPAPRVGGGHEAREENASKPLGKPKIPPAPTAARVAAIVAAAAAATADTAASAGGAQAGLNGKGKSKAAMVVPSAVRVGDAVGGDHSLAGQQQQRQQQPQQQKQQQQLAGSGGVPKNCDAAKLGGVAAAVTALIAAGGKNPNVVQTATLAK
ncbi:unnamed protein product, partial [Laminaria digitata]